MIFLLVLALLISLGNTAILMAIAGSLFKLVNQQAEEVEAVKQPARPQNAYTVDLPVARQPNYSDMMAMQKPSTDLKIIKDI